MGIEQAHGLLVKALRMPAHYVRNAYGHGRVKEDIAPGESATLVHLPEDIQKFLRALNRK